MNYKLETVKHLYNHSLPVRELVYEDDFSYDFVYTAIGKGLTEKHFWIAWRLREDDLIPMKWSLNRMLNENGRVFSSYDAQNDFIMVRNASGYLVVNPVYRRFMRRYHRRLDVGKEYAVKLGLAVSRGL